MACAAGGIRRNGSLWWAGAICVSIAAAMLVAIWTGMLATDGRAWTNTDFSNYWIASRLVLDGQTMDLFSGQDAYFRHMQAAFGPDYPWHNWSYPPSFLLMIWPLGLMPHAPSMILFLLVTVCIFLHSVSITERNVHPIVPLLLSMFVLCNGFLAQNGFLTAALMLYGLALRDRSPILAGIAFGLLTVKPQLGLLVPFLLLYERRWTVMLAASATACLLVAFSAVIFGIDSWRGYLEHNIPYQGRVMTELSGVFLAMMPSVFGYLRSLGVGPDTAMLIHLPLAALSFAAFLFGIVRSAALPERGLLLAMASFLVSPYALIYDMGALSALTAIAVSRSLTAGVGRMVQILLFSLPASLPILHPILSAAWGLPVAPTVLVLGLVVLLFGQGLPRARPVGA